MVEVRVKNLQVGANIFSIVVQMHTALRTTGHGVLSLLFLRMEHYWTSRTIYAFYDAASKPSLRPPGSVARDHHGVAMCDVEFLTWWCRCP